ncbi:UNVERIFIED_CONTAM: hypothetical protein Slati_1740300 [Sesamum latifolium]|uniref:Exo_endo_phos domain-containing protein n=1 Tax=Sesamum latifolium TaxID=2727402 RepID=A0AAW2WWV0_9LAMI
MGINGELDASRRRLVWEKLMLLSNQFDAPWLCAGDYNEVLFQHVKTGGDRPQWQMEDFRRTLEQCDLCDLGYSGSKYTWCNRRQGPHTVSARLDRACGNSRWVSYFPNSIVSTLPTPYSDHSILIVQWELTARSL